MANEIVGTTGDDTLTGTSADDHIQGLEGNDVLNGGNGEDTLDGGDGDDSLLGGTHVDSLVGGAGDDTLDGGADSNGWLAVSYLNGGSGNDRLIARGSDVIDGGGDTDTLDLVAIPGAKIDLDLGGWESLDTQGSLTFAVVGDIDGSQPGATPDDFLVIDGYGDAAVKSTQDTAWDQDDLNADGYLYDASPSDAAFAASTPEGAKAGAIADWNNDDVNEYLVAAPGSGIWARDPESGKWSVIAEYENADGVLALDIEAEAENRLVIYDKAQHKLVSLDENGDVVWSSNLPTTATEDPLVLLASGDFDGPSVFLDHAMVAYVQGAGLFRWTNTDPTWRAFTKVDAGEEITAIGIADVNDDGSEDLIYHVKDVGTRWISQGHLLFDPGWLLKYENGFNPDGMLSVADLDGDGFPELIGVNGGSVMTHRFNPGGIITENIENMVGSQWDDHLIGDTGDNVLDGGQGDDYIDGDQGDDTLLGGSDHDTLMGGQGYDYLDGGNSNNVLNGGAHADTLMGGQNNDDLDGGDPLDVANQAALAGADILSGGAGDDTLRMADFTYADQGDGGSGTDLISLRDAEQGVHIDMVNGQVRSIPSPTIHTFENVENAEGSAYDDKLIGDANANVLDGGGGADVLLGGDGDDTLIGGDGNDYLVGGDGVDYLDGGAGDDTIVVDADGSGNILDTVVVDNVGRDTILLTGATVGSTLNLNNMNWQELGSLGPTDPDVLTVSLGNKQGDSVGGGLREFDAGDLGFGDDLVAIDDEGTVFRVLDLESSWNATSRQFDISLDWTTYEETSGKWATWTVPRGSDPLYDVAGQAEMLIAVEDEGSVRYHDTDPNDDPEDWEWTLYESNVPPNEQDGRATHQVISGNVYPTLSVGAYEQDVFHWETDTVTGAGYLRKTYSGEDDLFDVEVDGVGSNDPLFATGDIDGALFTDQEYLEYNDELVAWFDGASGAGFYLLSDIFDNPSDSIPTWTYYDASPNANAEVTAMGIHDIDGDGIGDIIYHLADNAYYDGGTYWISGDNSQSEAQILGLNDQVSITGEINVADINGDGLWEMIATVDGRIQWRTFVAGQSVYGGTNATGTNFDDILTGNWAANLIQGDNGNDRLYGNGDNDTIYGGLSGDPDYSGDDYLDGGDGDDYLHGGDGDDILEGGAGDDDLIGYHDDDTLSGGAGADTLSGGSGQDILLGGDGDDHLYGDNDADTLDGGAGADWINGGAGADLFRMRVGDGDTVIGGGDHDEITFADAAQGVSVSVAAGQAAGNDISGVLRVIGGAFNDTLIGSDQSDRLRGLAGDDYLQGDNLNDTLDGGDGNDTLSGGNQNDSLLGGDGDDLLNPGSGADYVDGGDGIDTVTYAGQAGPLDIDLAAGSAGSDTLVGIENAIGSSGADTISGDAGVNHLQGLGGNDTISGLAGDDSLEGGDGADVLDGGDGDDSLVGDDGNDVLDGGDGYDRLRGGDGDDLLKGDGLDLYDGGAGDDTVSFADAGAGVKVSLANTDWRPVFDDTSGVYTQVAVGDFEADGAGNGFGDDLLALKMVESGGQTIGNVVRVQDLNDRDVTASGSFDIDLQDTDEFEEIDLTLLQPNNPTTDLGATWVTLSDRHTAQGAAPYPDKMYVVVGDGSDAGVWWYDDTSGPGTELWKNAVPQSGVSQVWGADINWTSGVVDGDELYYHQAPNWNKLPDGGTPASKWEFPLISDQGEPLFAFGDLNDAHDVESVEEMVAWFKGPQGQGIYRLDPHPDPVWELLAAGPDGSTEITALGVHDVDGDGHGDVLYHEKDFGTWWISGGDAAATPQLLGQSGATASPTLSVTDLNDDGVWDLVSVVDGQVQWRSIDAASTATFYSVEHVVGSAYADTITGNGQDDDISGGWGQDILYGGAGDDTLDGDQNSDTLYGGDGDDLLGGGYGSADSNSADNGIGNTYYGGTGDDTIHGTRFEDHYYFNQGDGSDRIIDIYAISGDDTLYLDSSLSFGVNNVYADDHHMVFDFGDGDKITIENWYWDARIAQIEKVVHNGVTYTAEEIENDFARILIGTDTNDTLTNGDDFIDADAYFQGLLVKGLTGDDTLHGDYQRDTLYGNGGEYVDELDTDADRLDGEEARDIYYGGGGNDTLGGGVGTVDYTSLDWEDTIAYGNDYYGGEGDDLLLGAKGEDHYYFDAGDGSDTIVEWYGNIGTNDTLHLLDNALDLTEDNVTIDGDDLIFDFGANGKVTVQDWFNTNVLAKLEAVEVAGVQTPYDTEAIEALARVFNGEDTILGDTLTGHDVIDVYSPHQAVIINGLSGNDVLTGDYLQDTLNGGTGNDQLDGEAHRDFYDGGAGDDTLGGGYGTTDYFWADYDGGAIPYGNIYDGGTGDDLLLGAKGEDHYYFEDGDGSDTIVELYGTAGTTDTLFLDSSFTLTEDNVYVDGADLVMDLGGGNSVTVQDWFYEVLNAKLEAVSIDGGSAYDTAQMEAMATVFNGADDSLNGDTIDVDTSYAAVTINGLAGDDSLTGAYLRDTLNGGDGNDTLDGVHGRDFLDGGAGDDILGGGYGATDYYHADNEGGVDYGNIYDGGTGDDTLKGTKFEDHYHYDSGDGADVIIEYYPNSGTDTLFLESTLSVTEESVSIDGADLVMDFGGANSVTVQDWFISAFSAKLESVSIDGGSTFDTAQMEAMASVAFGDDGQGDAMSASSYLSAMELNGLGGDDTLTGGTGDDTLVGGTGADILAGGSGADQYLFNTGDGADLVQEDAADSSSDRALFGSGIDKSDIILSKDGGDLILDYGALDSVRIEDWDTSAGYQVETIETTAGDALLNTQVDQLIQAMATFVTNNSYADWAEALAQDPTGTETILATYWQPAT